MKRFRNPNNCDSEVLYPEDRKMNPSITKKHRPDTFQSVDTDGFYIRNGEGQVVDYVWYKDFYPEISRIFKKDSEGMIYIDGD